MAAVSAGSAGPDRAPILAGGVAGTQVVLIAAATVVTTTLYGAFFAEWGFLPRLITVAVVACALALAVARFSPRPSSTVIAGSAGFVVTALLLVLPGTLHDGLPGSLTAHTGWRALTGGWAAMLSIAAPAPDSPQMLMAPTLVTWLAGFLAVTCALRTRSVLGPAAILVCAQVVGLIFASNQSTTHLIQTCVLLILLLPLTMARAGGPPSQPSESLSRSTRRAVVFTVALTEVGLFAALATAPLDASQRYNPRDLLATRLQSEQTVNPLSAVREQLRLATPRNLFTVTITGTGAGTDPVSLIQTVALEDFDGSQWSSPDSFRVAGPVLAAGPATAGAVTLTEHVTLSTLTGPYLPVAGRATRIDADLGSNALIGFDPASGTLLAENGDSDGGSYTVTAEKPAGEAGAPAGLANAAIGSGTNFAQDLLLPPVPDTLAALAFQITAGQATPYAKLTALVAYLSALPVNLNAPAGNSYGSLVRLLTADSPQGKAGYADQHASAFAILARIEHIPTRVVVGYRLPSTSTTRDSSRSYTVTTADSYAWAQAYFQGYGWIDFDPTDTTDTVALPSASPVQALASAQPSVSRSFTPSTAPTEPLTQSARPEPTPVAGPRQGLGSGSVPIRIVIPVLALLVCIALAATTAARRVLRRLRRRRAEKPAVKMVGAWQETVDRLADTGVAVRASETALDLAARANQAKQARPPRPTREQRALALAAPYLEELATEVTAAAFNRDEPGARDVDRAWRLEHQISKALYRGRRAPYRAAHWTIPVPRHRAPGRRR